MLAFVVSFLLRIVFYPLLFHLLEEVESVEGFCIRHEYIACCATLVLLSSLTRGPSVAWAVLPYPILPPEKGRGA